MRSPAALLLAVLAPATSFAASIHFPRDLASGSSLTLPSGWTYAGCAVDNVNPRSLSLASIYGPSNTADACIAFCAAKGYNTAGTEYGAECYCGFTLPAPADESTCNMPCSGDSSQACGGPSRLSVYRNNQMTAPSVYQGDSNWKYEGCVADSQQSRTLKNFVSVSGDMTVEKCLAAGTAAGFAYCGVEVCLSPYHGIC
jgi:hypothetical protein